MDGLIIFDHSNDIIYKKFNNAMCQKIRQIALAQELITIESADDEHMNNNIALQIFSPIINSQKIMFCQFDNTYTTFQCDNDINFVFDEFLGYLFLKIGSGSVDKLRRSLKISVAFARNVCGTNLFILKTRDCKANLFTDLLNSWEELYDTEQGILLEAVEQVLVNADIKLAISKTLEAAIEKLKQDPHSQRCHAVLYVNGKFLGLFSSRQAQKLSPSDILFLTILCKNLQSKMNSKAINIQSHLLFLKGQSTGNCSGCTPYIVHHSILDKGIVLILLIENGIGQISSGLYEIFFALQKTQNIQMQGDFENLRPSFDNLEVFVKQTIEALRKAKYNNAEIEACIKKFCLKWDILKKKCNEFFKSSDKNLVIGIESNIPAFTDELKELFTLTCLEYNALDQGFERVSELSTLVEERLLEFTEFIFVKSQRNLSIQSYLEEFPGLVHFIYIDRTVGNIVVPAITNNSGLIPKEKVWSMVELSRAYLSKGHTSVMWKDTAFNYSYFLWFEDQHGTSIKPKELKNQFATAPGTKPQYEPGILAGDYYVRLCETSFPKLSPNKLKCFELYCIHLGLVTATCALEHCRRLVATINDVAIVPSLELA